jgi:hypothetical protein
MIAPNQVENATAKQVKEIFRYLSDEEIEQMCDLQHAKLRARRARAERKRRKQIGYWGQGSTVKS